MKFPTPFLCTLYMSISLTKALPAQTEDGVLTIPKSNYVANDLSEYSSHPLFSKFTEWIAEFPSVGLIAGNETHAKAEEYATLTGFQCDADKCMFSSSLKIDAREFSEPEDEPHIFKRADAGAYRMSTHWKTYYAGENQGDEHYISWNLRCGRLDYSATSFTLTGDDIKSYSNNDISTWVRAYSHRTVQHRTLKFQQNFACKWNSNQCCTSYTYLTNEGSGNIRDSTFECVKAEKASACQG
ncbi:hypothetical protein F5B20DRAFT_559847 [Whalleya microplaca]|nr:hypothetical protein F5B20DRAFT_559847 [Whalleya microplaca]